MNELNKLIEQFAKEENLPAFMIYALIREVEDEKGTWLNKLLEFLATRPTCGKEQRLFLDMLEITETSKSLGGHPYIDRIWQDDTEADLEKVIKGE